MINANQCSLPNLKPLSLELGLRKYKIQHILTVLLPKGPLRSNKVNEYPHFVLLTSYKKLAFGNPKWVEGSQR